MADTDARVVLVTLPDPVAAEEMVGRLVEERVVACGNIVSGMTSIYRWKGEVEHASEALVIFKTTRAGVERLLRRVPELHPYDVPEVLAIPVESGHGPYLDWIVDNVGSGGEDARDQTT